MWPEGGMTRPLSMKCASVLDTSINEAFPPLSFLLRIIQLLLSFFKTHHWSPLGTNTPVLTATLTGCQKRCSHQIIAPLSSSLTHLATEAAPEQQFTPADSLFCHVNREGLVGYLFTRIERHFSFKLHRQTSGSQKAGGTTEQLWKQTRSCHEEQAKSLTTHFLSRLWGLFKSHFISGLTPTCRLVEESILTEMTADRISIPPVLRVMYGMRSSSKPAARRIPLV